MKLLTAALNRIPEFQQLLSALEGGRSPAALSGAAAIHRAHIAAGIGLIAQRPVVVVCADEGEGQKLARDLSAFAGTTVPVLGPRDFTFHNAAALSRQWEHRRLALMRGLSQGKYPFLVATVEGLLQRTMPRDALERCCRELSVGGVCDLNQLAEDLSAAGYVRCGQVEGVGQFALRGGILDVFSPGMDSPVRVEFFGDEVDAMGVFDPATQRRTENVETALLLPAAEVLPQLAPEGLAGLSRQLSKLAAKALQRGNKPLAATLEADGEAIAQGRDVTLIDALAAKSADLIGYDLIGFASGIYFGRFHQSVVEFAKNNLPRDKKVFFLATYGGSNGTKAIEEAVRKIQAAYDDGERPVPASCKRILVTGCPIGGVLEKTVGVIEENGGAVVCFENCSGIKAAYQMVDSEAEDIVAAIAARYLEIGCAVLSPNEKRKEHLKRLVREFQVDGVVEVDLQACATYSIESHGMQELMRGLGGPYMALETDYSQSDRGQLSTRLGAFLERL